MKVKFKVEKDYKGKRYYPNIEYVVNDETAKDILSKTKYAEVVEENAIIEDEVSEEVVQAVASAIVEQAEEDNKSVEAVVSEIIVEKEQKRTKNSKKTAKKEENAQ